MGTGYTRNDTANNIADGNIINAADLDGEFDAIEAAFATTGHTHDGTAAEGGAILVLGPSQEFVASSTEVKPSANAGLSLGTDLLQFNNLYIDGTAYIDGLGESILVDTDSKIQFRDTALFINSSADGQLDLAADTTIELTAPTVSLTNDLKLKSDSGILYFGADDDVTLTHNADAGLSAKTANGFSLRLQTSDTTIENGNLLGKIMFQAPNEASGGDAILVGASVEAIAEATFDSTTNSTALVFKTNTSGGATERMRLTSAGDLHFKDSRKAIFGDGSDLQIYHSGSASYISENSSSGALLIQGEELILENPDGTNYFRAATDGSVKLYNSGAVKLSTKSGGVDITGTGDVNGAALVVDDGGSLGIEIQSSTPTILFKEDDTTDENYQIRLSSGDLLFQTQNDARNSAASQMILDASGNLGVGGTPTAGITNATTLHIRNSTTNYAQLRLTNSTSGHAALSGFEIHTNGTDGFINNREAGDIHFYANGGHKASIMSSGRFGIGTESPQTMLEVEADSGASDGSVSAPVAIRITDTLSSQSSTTDVVNNYGELQFFSRDTSNEGPIIQASIGAKYDDIYAAGSDLTFSTWNAGLASPEERLRINSTGDIIIKNSSYNGTLYTETAGSGNLRIGLHAGDAITSGGNNNTFLGDYAGTSVTEGDNNVAIGGDALQNSVTNSNNTIMGRAAGYNLVGSNNTAVGFNALYGTSGGTAIGSYNVALGYQSLYDLTDGTHNMAIGYRSAFNITGGDNNVAIGNQALYTGTTVDRNIAIGTNSLYYATQNGNVAIGHAAAQDMSTGGPIVAIGDYAGTNLTSATVTTLLGYQAGYNLTTGSQNTLIGHQAGTNLTTKNQNTAVGGLALYSAGLTGDAGRNVAIGYQSLYNLDPSSDADTHNTAVGYNVAYNITTGSENTMVGNYAGFGISTGNSNTGLGYQTMYGNGLAQVTGDNNVGIGKWSLFYLTSGSANIAIGRDALQSTTTASNNVAIGFQALLDNVTGSANVAIGHEAMENGTGTHNVAIGYNAGFNDPADRNVWLGSQAGYGQASGAVNTADGNIGIGYQAMYDHTTSTYNIAIGDLAGTDITTGSQNIVIGVDTGGDLTTGDQNTIVGSTAGRLLTTGEYNVYMGKDAGRANLAGSYNTMIGMQAGYSYNETGTPTGRNTFIGHNAGYYVSTGYRNTIVGRFNGNEKNLDIRTLSNQVVLSDGDGEPVFYANSDHDIWLSGGNGLAAGTLLPNAGNGGTGYPRLVATKEFTSAEGTSVPQAMIHAHAYTAGTPADGFGSAILMSAEGETSAQRGAFIVGGAEDVTLLSRDGYFGIYVSQYGSAYVQRFNIASNGSITASDTSIGTLSDERLKENIGSYSYDLSDFKSLTPKTFNWINTGENSPHPEGQQFGFIAQEVEAVDDNWVDTYLVPSGDPDRDLLGDETRGKTTVLGKKDAMYVSVIQQLITKIETLEAKVTALENA